MTSIRKIAVTRKIWLSALRFVTLFNLLAMPSAYAQAPALKVDERGNTTVNGNLQVAGADHNINVDGNILIGSTHLMFNSENGVIDWGDSGRGSLFFRTVTPRGQTGNQVDRMIISNDGSVRIPGALTLGSLSGDLAVSANATIRGGHLILGRPDYKVGIIGWQAGSSLGFRTYDDKGYSQKVTISAEGRMGIGTENPRRAMLEVIGSAPTPRDIGDSWEHGWGAGGYPVHGPSGRLYSIYASNQIAGSHFNTFSDARIKNVEARSDGAADLKTLMAIEVTDYRYIDTAAFGDGPQKKVIAQQVETVYPQAVEKNVDAIPDIYKPAYLRDGWVELETNLQKGQRVKLIGDGEQGIFEVLAVTNNAFQVDFKPKSEKIFVYGKEVNDFRTVDYDAIAMLNVSATQQIKKEADVELNALKAENEKLRGRIEALEARGAERDAQMKEIQRLLLGSNQPTSKASSNQTGGVPSGPALAQ